MTIRKFIKVNSIEIQQGLCSVCFRIVSDLDSMHSVEITHGKLYELLDSANEVKTCEMNENNQTRFCKFRQGMIWYTAYINQYYKK
mgnify:CR=1 FL=1